VRRDARRIALIAALGCIGQVGAAHAERWTFSASAGATETYNHYIGANQPSDGFVTSLNAALGFHGEGARLKINGTLSATETFYAGQGANNSFAPGANVTATLEAIEKFFWVDATASVTKNYASPFGPQPANLTVSTANRYTSETYSVSPYIKGVIAPNISYSVRDDNIWTTSSSYGDSSVKAPSTYANSLTADLSSTVGYWGWDLQYQSQYYDNGLDTGTYLIQVARAIVSYRIDPQLEVSGRAGYESDRFPGTSTLGADTAGTVYGAGLHWRPTERTDLNGFWEHHFYGSSYSWALTHRLPNVALSANFTRGLSNFPQLSLVIPAGVTVAQFLDAAFTTRIPDPVERALAVARFLAQTGLPPTLASPLNYYSPTISLQNTALVSAVWVGALNQVGVSVFRTESESVSNTGQELPPAFRFSTNTIQTGGSVFYSRPLSAFTHFTASLTYSRTTPNTADETVSSFRSDNFNANVGLSTNFSPKTTGSVGISYFIFETPGSGVARQSTLSAYATISHTF